MVGIKVHPSIGVLQGSCDGKDIESKVVSPEVTMRLWSRAPVWQVFATNNLSHEPDGARLKLVVDGFARLIIS